VTALQNNACSLQYFSFKQICLLGYCNRTFFVCLFIRFTRVSYRQFIAIRYKFTYILEPLVVGELVYRKRFKRENG
jgi:hypothetical protein